jgi:hypothetical protein
MNQSRRPEGQDPAATGLESYLDALLQDATEEEQPVLVLEPVLEPESTLDEFQLAVLEEQARDAKPLAAPMPAPVKPAVVAPVVAPVPSWSSRWSTCTCRQASRRRR